jgi:cytochrome c peroxidase
MASHLTGNRFNIAHIRLPLIIALLGPALLISRGSSGQQPPPAVAPPAITADSFKTDAAGHSTGHSKPITVPPGQEQSILPPGTPPYFRKIFHQFLQAPLPAEIFQQGGVPAVIPEYEVDPDASGRTASYQPLGPTTTSSNAFFQSLGSNGRTCVTCHLPPNAMSVSTENINSRWNATTGNDPIFAPVDGADCPNKPAPINSRAAHSMLLDRGLFRIFLPIPDNPEFTVTVLHDPTDSATTQPPFNKDGCNTDPTYAAPPDSSGKPVPTLSMYRRPRIAGNLTYVQITRSDVDNGGAPPAGGTELSLANPNPATDPIQPVPPPNPVPPLIVQGVKIDPGTGRAISGNIMWDGREPTLEQQAIDATHGHAQATTTPSDSQVAEMVQFELGIYNAQVWDAWAHQLNDKGALGGPIYLSNGTPGLSPQVAGATFPLFDDWSSLPVTVDRAAQRASVARGEVIFETRTFSINGVAGLTNIGAVKAQQLGTCSSCHNQVNTGNDSFVAAQHDIGVGGTSPAPGAPPVSPPPPTTFPQPSTELPIFELDCTASGKTTVYQGPKVVTNDPGLAMITGKCADIGRFTVPQLRGLAARAPYFSDGSAATLLDVTSFYNTRFGIGLSNQDEQDLVAFLRSL